MLRAEAGVEAMTVFVNAHVQLKGSLAQCVLCRPCADHRPRAPFWTPGSDVLLPEALKHQPPTYHARASVLSAACAPPWQPCKPPLLANPPPQDEMLPPQQMQELFDLHPEDPWRIVYFDGTPPRSAVAECLSVVQRPCLPMVGR